MRPVVGWFFLFFCFADAETNDAQATIAATASAAASSPQRAERSFVPSVRGMSLGFLRRAQVLVSELLEAVAAARACAEREQARTKEEQRRGLGHARRRRRRATVADASGRRLFVARADAAEADERDAAEERPPRKSGLRDGGRRNLAAVADRAGNVAEVYSLDLAAALRERRVGGRRRIRRAALLRGLRGADLLLRGVGGGRAVLGRGRL